MELLTFIIGIIIGAGAVWLYGRKSASQGPKAESEDRTAEETESDAHPGNDEPPLISRQAREKEENIEKILEMLKQREKVTNNDIEELLGVSDATATRYLQELEEQGRIRQVGEEGRHIYYEKTDAS